MKLLKFIFLFSFPIIAQNVEVISLQQITTQQQGSFYYPKFIDSERIALTSPNFKGLWLLEKEMNLTHLNDFNSAGYDFSFLPDGNSILCRSDKFIDGMKFTDLIKQNIENKNVELVQKDLRNLHMLSNGRKTSVSFISEMKAELNSDANLNQADVYADAEGIHLFQSGNEKLIQPLGEGNYIWASISPDGNKILFNYPSKGSFVSDLSGNILSELGHANYPSWSRDGNWIIYMKDYDNGVEITSSDIFIRKYLGKDEINLTNTKDKTELYPSFSQFADEILFNTIEGVVYKLSIKFN